MVVIVAIIVVTIMIAIVIITVIIVRAGEPGGPPTPARAGGIKNNLRITNKKRKI